MSVMTYGPAEIAKVYADIRGLKGRVLAFGDERELREALAAAYLANKAALAMTYGDPVTFAQFDVPDEISTNPDPCEVYTEIGLLLYNCISNGGRDFLPEQDRTVLEGVRAGIAQHFIELAARRPGRSVKKGGDSHDQG